MHYCKKYLIPVAAFLLVTLSFSAQVDSLTSEKSDEDCATKTEEKNKEVDIKGPLDNGSVESISYELYLNKQWKALALYCERAFKMDFDYYYLRVRAGVAYFELEQYRKAIIHFEKALNFNSGDDFANSYLYYAYLYSERPEDSKRLIGSFSEALSSTMGTTSFSPVDFASVESGIKSPDSSHQFKNAFLIAASVGHTISRKFSLCHTLTYFQQGEERFEVKQTQYYLRATMPLAKDYVIAGGVHFVNVNAGVRSFSTSVITKTLSAQPPGQPGAQPFPVQYKDTVYQEKITKKINNNFVVALNMTKRMLYTDLSAGVTFGNFDTTGQIQVGLGFNAYPFKNNRLSLGGTVYFHSENSGETNNIALAPALNAYLSKRLHLSVSALSNKGSNISENVGAFVSNSIDYTSQRISATISAGIASGLWLYGTYAYEEKKQRTAGYRYDYNIFVLGIKVFPQYK